MSKSKKQLDRSAAFSLFELLIAIVIIAILAGAATLNFCGSIDYAKLQNATAKLTADLQLVRDQARRDQQPRTLTIDPDNLSYQATGVPSLDSPQDISVNLAEPPYQLSTLKFEPAGNYSITFDARGLPASTDSTITLCRGSKQTTIEIAQGGSIEQINQAK